VAHWHLYDNPIEVPQSAEYVWLRVDVDQLEYRYSYSFDGENWQTIPLTFEAWKLSDDYIGGGASLPGRLLACTARISAATAAMLISPRLPISPRRSRTAG
jgi:beta-xylosidase